MKAIHYVCQLTAALFPCALLTMSSPAYAASNSVPTEIERAVRAEDWKTVANFSTPLPDDNAMPVLRFLQGHACLALNRNNDSVRLLRDTGKNDELDAWLDWAHSFAGTHGQSPIASLLLGDAQTRQGRHADALNAFNTGLKIAPKHALLLNARAVCYAAMHKWNEAIVDLDDAARANATLADIHANRGTVNIRRSLGARGALAAFTRALEISPDFLLARTGLASALYGEGNWAQAQKNLEALKPDAEHQFLVEANLLLIRGNAIEGLALSGMDSQAGTTIDRFQVEISAARSAHSESVANTKLAWAFDKVETGMNDLGIGMRWAGKTAQAFVPKIENVDGKWRVTAVDVGGGFASVGKDLQSAGRVVGQIGATYRERAALGNQDANNRLRAAYNIASQGGKSGGVSTEELRRGFLDKGTWGLLARFALQFPDPVSADSPKNQSPTAQ